MLAAQSAFALKARQRAVLSDALSTHSAGPPPHWHILVADATAHAILTALFTPAQLRSHGVTLLLQLSAPRASVPDVPAHYIVSPTTENIAWLARDLSGSPPFYATAHVSFTTTIDAKLLAALAAQLPLPSPLSRVRDLHTSFLSLHPNLFTLQTPRALELAAAARDDSSVHSFITPIVDGLFSVLLTLAVIPIIRAQRAGPAEAVAAALDARLRDNITLFQRAALGARALSFRRPLLLLLDRDFDLPAMLHHAWTYHALIHDCLDLRGNTLHSNVPPQAGTTELVEKSYLLDGEIDDFWHKHASSPFPVVAEAVEASLSSYRDDVAALNCRAGTQESAGTAHLADAIATLPELSRQKETIDTHTNIATALLSHINARALDSFFELETQLVAEPRPVSAQTAQAYKTPVLQLLHPVSPTADAPPEERRGLGTPVDRLRLFLIYYSLFGHVLSEQDMVEFRDALSASGADLAVVDHVGRTRGFRHDATPTASFLPSGTLNTAKIKGLMKSVVTTGFRGIAGVAKSAKQLVVQQSQSFAVARTLDLFMNETRRQAGDVSDVLDGFLLFDPKVVPTGGVVRSSISTESGNGRPNMQRAVFTDAIVFTVGGGNYVEFEDCMRVASSDGDERNVLYGSTEMLTPDEFVSQLGAVVKLSK